MIVEAEAATWVLWGVLPELDEADRDQRDRAGDGRRDPQRPDGLNRAAVDALKRWRFRPATRQGDAVAWNQVLTFRFAR